jgi:hypothetical protein
MSNRTVNKHFKDITEIFIHYYPYMQKETEDYNLCNEYNWIQMFDSIYDDATIYNNILR